MGADTWTARLAEASAPRTWLSERVLPWVALAYVALMAGSIFPPFVPLFGPLSLDDLFPLLAVAGALLLVPFSRRPLPFDRTILPFAGLALVALLSSAANAESFGDFGRLAGRSTGRLVFYASLILTTRVLLDRGDWARRGLLAVAIAASLQGAFCVFAYLTEFRGPYDMGVSDFAHWSVLKGKYRVQGTFSGAPSAYEFVYSSANFLAAYLVMSIPVTAGLALVEPKRRNQLLLGLGLLLQVVSIYLTYTRAALGAVGITVLVMGWLLGRRKLAVFALLVGIAGAMAVPSMRTKILHEKHDRHALYTAAATMAWDHPVFGVGDGNYHRHLHENQRYFYNAEGAATTSAHNSALLSAAIHGLAGGAIHLALNLLLLTVAVAAARRASGSAKILTAATAAALFGFVAQDQVNDLAFVPKVVTQAWFLFGLVWILPGARSEPRPPRSAGPPG